MKERRGKVVEEFHFLTFRIHSENWPQTEVKKKMHSNWNIIKTKKKRIKMKKETKKNKKRNKEYGLKLFKRYRLLMKIKTVHSKNKEWKE